jgi:hypothetical protein
MKTYLPIEVIEKIIKYTDLNTALKYGNDRITKTLCNVNSYMEMLKTNNVNGMKWLISNKIPGNKKNILKHAAASSMPQMVKIILRNFPKKYEEEVLILAVMSGNMDTIRYLHKKHPEKHTHLVLNMTLHRGNLEILKFLRENRDDDVSLNIFDIAVYGGHLDMIKYIHQTENDRPSINSVLSAIKKGRLEILKFLCLHYEDFEDISVIVLATKSKQYEIVKWSFEEKIGDIGIDKLEYCIDLACELGSLDILTFLLENTDNLNDNSMMLISASEYGNIEIVRYLYHTFDIVDIMIPILNSVSRGYLDMLKIFEDRFTKDHITSAKYNAELYNQHKILEYLNQL